MIDDYKKNFLIPVMTEIDATIQKKQTNYNALQKAISSGPALPEKVNMSDLETTKELMNKIMKKYID